jgi:transcription initiation factor TFIIIB Brf1 subunit/transcription initiation factor TFIIB
MPNCPNCDYLLVLLEKRRKYKCAKCGKLFVQREIDLKEFQEWNKRQRQEEMKKIHPKLHSLRAYQGKNPERMKEYQRRYREKNKEKISQQKAKYYEANRSMLVEKSKEWRKGLNGQEKKEQNEKRQVRRRANTEGTRLQSRINYWRQRQKTFALLNYENTVQKAYNSVLDFILPTSLLS